MFSLVLLTLNWQVSPQTNSSNHQHFEDKESTFSIMELISDLAAMPLIKVIDDLSKRVEDIIITRGKRSISWSHHPKLVTCELWQCDMEVHINKKLPSKAGNSKDGKGEADVAKLAIRGWRQLRCREYHRNEKEKNVIKTILRRPFVTVYIQTQLITSVKYGYAKRQTRIMRSTVVAYRILITD